jgi:hypothetical protein
MKRTTLRSGQLARLLALLCLLACVASCNDGCQEDDLVGCYGDPLIPCCNLHGKPNCVYQVGYTSHGDRIMAEYIMNDEGLAAIIPCDKLDFQSLVDCP